MQYSNLGRSGLKVSRIGIGCAWFGDPQWKSWALPEAQSRTIIKRAIEFGINLIDTAFQYSNGLSEVIVGRAWRDFARREELVIATKIFHPTGPSPNERGLSRKFLLAAVDAALKRLQTDYIDLLQIHRNDVNTPIEETLEALNDIVRAGKARYIGASNMLAWQMMRMLAICDCHGWSRPISVQNHYNLAYREEEREMLPLCLAEGVGYMAWSPLARGFLAGKVARDGAGMTQRANDDTTLRSFFGEPHDFDVVDALNACAARYNFTPAQIAIAWIMGKPGVTAPILGASNVEHVEQAVQALEIKFSPEDVKALEAPYRPHRVLLHS
jgi:1-deoxyxylulose-5-phosphate synthase